MSLELIEITVTKYPVGVTAPICDYDMWLVEPEDISNPIPYPEQISESEKVRLEWQGIYENSVRFFETGYGFDFRFFGNSNNGDWSGGIEWNVDGMGLEDAMRPHLESILKLFDFDDKDVPTRLKWVTVWKYESYHTPSSPYGPEEYDCDWWVLGLLDIGRNEIKFKAT
jgi:hypothetical protein